MSNIIKYDYGRAEELRQKVKSMVTNIKGDLNTFKNRSIQETSEWWSGPDQDAFVKKFEQTATQINKLFEDFDNFYNTLITNISKSKQENTSSIAKNM